MKKMFAFLLTSMMMMFVSCSSPPVPVVEDEVTPEEVIESTSQELDSVTIQEVELQEQAFQDVELSDLPVAIIEKLSYSFTLPITQRQNSTHKQNPLQGYTQKNFVKYRRYNQFRC